MSAAAICRKFCEGKISESAARTSGSRAYFLSELYAVPEQIRILYFKLKVMELFAVSGGGELPRRTTNRRTFYRTQVEKVKAIERYLTEHMDENITQRELSERFDIPQTG